jgi:ubiquinone/menaquinone biosynthesis C-methylase UbiE
VGKRRTTTATTRITSSRRYAFNSICTFDESDFPGTVGDWPYDDQDMMRFDNTDDSAFYDIPRFVKHIDDGAIEALTSFYRSEFASLQEAKKKKKATTKDATTTTSALDILDLCSSWISHYPEATTSDSIQYGRVVGLGMNGKELEANTQLTEFIVQDLNQQPNLSQLDDSCMDVITNVVSVDYLTQPQLIFPEMYRVLRPGGVALMSFSNRCFATKVVNMWLKADDIGRLTIVGSYFHYSAPWESIEAMDLRPKLITPVRPSPGELFSNPALGLAWMSSATAVAKANAGDPMFVVKAIK